MANQPRRHPLNVDGPFYVVDGCCTVCGVPDAMAPEIFGGADHHCYVKRQPVSDAEVERTLMVLHSQELGCIRYAGTDRTILVRLAEAGESSVCDSAPGDIAPVLRNVVTFTLFDASDGSTITLTDFVNYCRNRWPHVPLRTKRHWFNGRSLSISWFKNYFHGLTIRSVDDQRHRGMITHSGPLAVSEWLHDWLSSLACVRDVRWWTEDAWSKGGPYQERPW